MSAEEREAFAFKRSRAMLALLCACGNLEELRLGQILAMAIKREALEYVGDDDLAARLFGLCTVVAPEAEA